MSMKQGRRLFNLLLMKDLKKKNAQHKWTPKKVQVVPPEEVKVKVEAFFDFPGTAADEEKKCFNWH